jgi:anti-anti-sigma regulatory factor
LVLAGRLRTLTASDLALAFSQRSRHDSSRGKSSVQTCGRPPPRLKRVLRALRARLVVLDLRELAFMDSSGVHAIVEASIRARQLGNRLLLLSGPPGVDRVFTLTASTDDVLSGDINAVEPSAQALMELVEDGLVS